MSRMNKKSKLITGIAVAGAAIIAVGGVGLVSKGFKNMDARDWVGGYEHVLEVSEDAQYLCATCGVDGTWKQEKRAEISFKSKDDDGAAAHSSAKLYDQDGKVFKRANVTVSAKITIDADTNAGITFGFGLTTSGPSYEGRSFFLDWDKDSELLRVVSVKCADMNSGDHYAPSDSNVVYTNSYGLSYYGLSSLKDIKMSVEKTVTATGSRYVVKVGNKVVDFLSCCDSEGNFVIEDGSTPEAEYVESKQAYPVYLSVYGTEATFKEVKWSENA
ncbi:MAG: hypothetical protein J6C23_03265 [Clostridia bacterium]|nr:hypothetical protein [Clostridia bacterium]